MAVINRTRTTSWNLFFHYVAIGMMFLNGVVLVPLYLARIPLETYGYWMATGNILAWLSLVDPGFSAIIQQRVATSYGAGNHAAVGQYLMAAIVVAVVMGLAVAGISLVAGGLLRDLLGMQHFGEWDDFIVAFSWAAAGTVLSISSFSLTAGSLGLQGALGPGVIYTVSQVVTLVLTIYWLQTGMGVEALGLAIFVRGLGLCFGAAGYLVWRLRREAIVCRFSYATLRELVLLSGFTFMAKIPGTLAGQLDVLLAARFLGPEAAAMFGLTRRGYDISRMIAERPTIALMPAVAHLAGEGNQGRLAQLALRMSRMTLWALGLLFAGFFIFNDDFMRLWIGDGHYAGRLVNALFASSMVLAVVTSSSSSVGFALGDVRRNSLANLVLSLVSIGALWLSARTGSIVALAAAPLVGLASVGLWYFPRSMSLRLGMTSGQWQGMGRECFGIIGVGAVLIMLVGSLRPETWLAFVAETVTFTLLFAAGVFAFSRTARTEAAGLWKRVGGRRAAP